MPINPCAEGVPLKKHIARTLKLFAVGFFIFWIGWFSAMIYSAPKCSNVDIAEDLLWPASFKRGMVHQVEYVEIIRFDPATGQISQAAVMNNPEDIIELFSHGDRGSYWNERPIDTHWLNVRMDDGKLVRLVVFNDSDLSGEITVWNAKCFGFRGTGDVHGAENTIRAFADGYAKISEFMSQD